MCCTCDTRATSHTRRATRNKNKLGLPPKGLRTGFMLHTWQILLASCMASAGLTLHTWQILHCFTHCIRRLHTPHMAKLNRTHTHELPQGFTLQTWQVAPRSVHFPHIHRAPRGAGNKGQSPLAAAPAPSTIWAPKEETRLHAMTTVPRRGHQSCDHAQHSMLRAPKHARGWHANSPLGANATAHKHTRSPLYYCLDTMIARARFPVSKPACYRFFLPFLPPPLLVTCRRGGVGPMDPPVGAEPTRGPGSDEEQWVGAEPHTELADMAPSMPLVSEPSEPTTASDTAPVRLVYEPAAPPSASEHSIKSGLPAGRPFLPSSALLPCTPWQSLAPSLPASMFAA